MPRATKKSASVFDPFEIPAFLRIPQAQRNAAWERNPPRAVNFVPQRASSPEAQAAIDAAAALKRDKENARLRGLKAKKRREPTDITGMRWNPRLARFEIDKFAHMVCRPGQGVNDTKFQLTDDEAPAEQPVRTGAKTMAESPRAVDNIGLKVSQLCGTDDAKLKSFAEANGVWNEKYLQLPNPGLRRMNVVNRLRGRLKKEPGYVIKWS